MDHYSELSIFVAVAELNGLAAAARKLEQSAPTITRAIAGLEQRLGLRLLERSTRGVRLTEAGSRYLHDCKRIIAEVEAAEASAAGAHATPGGTLTVAAPLLFGQELLTPILMDYLDAYPDVNCRALYMDRFPNLHEEGVDVAVLMGELPDSSLIAVKVGHIRRVVCASPDYLRAKGAPQHPEELHQHELVVSMADARASEWRFSGASTALKNSPDKKMRGQSEALTISVQARLCTSTNTSAITAALAGAGLTRVMSYQIAEHLDNGKLALVLEDFEPAPIPVHIVYREGRRAAARVRSFVDFAVKRLRERGE